MLTSEEKRNSTRDAIMEDGSIFDFVKTSIPSKITKTGNISDKEHKIESFKKVFGYRLVIIQSTLLVEYSVESHLTP